MAEPDCPHCLNHRWLIWREYPNNRKDLKPILLFKNCQYCNRDGKLKPPIWEETNG